MVVIKALLDSFSRCLGTNHTQASDPTMNMNTARPTESLSARARALNSNAADQSNVRDTATSTNLSQDQRKHSQMNLPDLGSNSNPKTTRLQTPQESDKEQAQILATARKKASADTPSRSRVRSSILTKSSSSLSHKASLEKARTRSNKRKLDIFRNVEQPSAFSKFLGGSQGGGFPGGAMLCFANPIFDSDDDDMRIRRRENIEDVTVDEETITSTLYFDAKYEHVVEKRQPVPLFRDHSVMQNQANDEIIQIYQSGGNKVIQSIYCGHPPPPPDVSNVSMVDDTSSNESDDETDDEDVSRSFFSDEDFARGTLDIDILNDTPSSCISIPSPPGCKPRDHLDVIDDLLDSEISNVPGLKLLSNSSNSMTATLTSIGSSRSTSASLSPRSNNNNVQSDIECLEQAVSTAI